LQENVVTGIKVQACRGECGGLWFDRFQFKKIESLKPGIGQSLLMIEKAEGIKIYREAEHTCSDCKTTLLYRHFFIAEGDTEINQCSKCRGFWVDLTGLAKLQLLPADQKIPAVEKYFTAVLDKKISEMRLRHDHISKQAQVLEQILKFLCPKGQ
jgi:uncharacterized protein